MSLRELELFRLEEYLAKREFSSKYMFCSSDMESRSIGSLLELLSESERQKFFDLHLGYTTPEGDKELRSQIALLYEKMQRENVLCFAGAEEAIYIAARVLLRSCDHALAITPCYQSLESVAKSICELTQVELELREGHWHLDFDKLARSIRSNTRVLFINFPHNPTGYIPSQELFQKIIALARKHNITVFSDEVYRGLELDEKDRLPNASDIYENALSLGVMSKSFGFAGLRIGWVSSQNTELLNKLGAYKHYLSICNSAPSEWLASLILKNKNLLLGENLSLLKANYLLVKSYFHKHQNLFRWIEPRGGCIAFPQYLGPESIFTLAEKLLKAKGVVILPDEIFGQNKQHFRVSFGRKNCAEALKYFADFFEDQKL